MVPFWGYPIFYPQPGEYSTGGQTVRIIELVLAQELAEPASPAAKLEAGRRLSRGPGGRWDAAVHVCVSGRGTFCFEIPVLRKLVKSSAIVVSVVSQRNGESTELARSSHNRTQVSGLPFCLLASSLHFLFRDFGLSVVF